MKDKGEVFVGINDESDNMGRDEYGTEDEIVEGMNNKVEGDSFRVDTIGLVEERDSCITEADTVVEGRNNIEDRGSCIVEKDVKVEGIFDVGVKGSNIVEEAIKVEESSITEDRVSCIVEGKEIGLVEAIAVLNDVVINTDVGLVVKEVDRFSIFISVVKEVGMVDSTITVDTIEDKGNVDVIKLLILKPVALILLLQTSVMLNKFKKYSLFRKHTLYI